MDSTGILLRCPLVGSSFRSPAPHLESIPVWKPLQPQREQRWTLPCLRGLGWLVASGPARKSLAHTPAAPGPGSLPDTSSHTPAPGLPWGLHLPPQSPLPVQGAGCQPGAGPSGSQDKQTVAVAQPSAGALPAPPAAVHSRSGALLRCQLGSSSLLLLSTPPREKRENSALSDRLAHGAANSCQSQPWNSSQAPKASLARKERWEQPLQQTGLLAEAPGLARAAGLQGAGSSDRTGCRRMLQARQVHRRGLGGLLSPDCQPLEGMDCLASTPTGCVGRALVIFP